MLPIFKNGEFYISSNKWIRNSKSRCYTLSFLFYFEYSEYKVDISKMYSILILSKCFDTKIWCIIYILTIFWLYDLCSKLRIIIFFHCPFIPRENPPQAVFPLLLVQQPYFSGYKVHVRENDITANSLL